MIETDAPYLLPRTVEADNRRTDRNEPMYLAHIVEELARDRGEDPRPRPRPATSATATAFFRLPGVNSG